MSRVFLAEETRLGRQVVIKVLPPEMGAGVNAERFEREIQLAARLQHPHIVPLLTAGASGDLLYYVMPYIAGESLRVKLSREGELPVAEAVRVLREVVQALAYAHRHGVVHRDIKPDNILLADGFAVVTDFGVAKAVSASGRRRSHRRMRSRRWEWRSARRPIWRRSRRRPIRTWITGPTSMPSACSGTRCSAGARPSSTPTPQAVLAAHITRAPEPVGPFRPAVSPASSRR